MSPSQPRRVWFKIAAFLPLSDSVSGRSVKLLRRILRRASCCRPKASTAWCAFTKLAGVRSSLAARSEWRACARMVEPGSRCFAHRSCNMRNRSWSAGSSSLFASAKHSENRQSVLLSLAVHPLFSMASTRTASVSACAAFVPLLQSDQLPALCGTASSKPLQQCITTPSRVFEVFLPGGAKAAASRRTSPSHSPRETGYADPV
jgi:hypothetical protein